MSREREKYAEIGKKIIRRDYSDASSSSFCHRRHQQMVGRRYYMVGSTPAGTLNTVIPCAACKLLRRRCAQECPFSPYFSPHEPHKFASVHKVFGASNVSKLLMKVPESRRADAANSLVYEANVRLRDPVYGCMGAISALQQEVRSLQAELDLVRDEIIKYSKYCRESHHTSILVPSHSYLVANLLSSKSGVVSVSAPPTVLQPSSLPLPPPPPLRLTSSSSFFYAPVSTASDYSTISDENIPYFG
ncbi:hypothetical protein RHMOL_Rhmol09G0242400 [Rhododendron molle]|uniref:Uncharacterized protein n=1 Tax=Rhododendron molle TaxID=49168 RepID=A0ACC0MHZ7_RHOML|nr:hypothetical protein RHMOL_Rhmol09G0242400 [Rhododendron molle]